MDYHCLLGQDSRGIRRWLDLACRQRQKMIAKTLSTLPTQLNYHDYKALCSYITFEIAVTFLF